MNLINANIKSINECHPVMLLISAAQPTDVVGARECYH